MEATQHPLAHVDADSAIAGLATLQVPALRAAIKAGKLATYLAGRLGDQAETSTSTFQQLDSPAVAELASMHADQEQEMLERFQELTPEEVDLISETIRELEGPTNDQVTWEFRNVAP